MGSGRAAMKNTDEAARFHAQQLTNDELDHAARGDGADDAWRAAARAEYRRRGRCGALSDDGDVCERVADHTASLPHERRMGPHVVVWWTYDHRDLLVGARIMVDELRIFPSAKRPFHLGSCHLTVDGPLIALHAFAIRIGMKRRWFQDHRIAAHYDLTPGRRVRAVALGAVEVPALEQARQRRRARAASPGCTAAR